MNTYPSGENHFHKQRFIKTGEKRKPLKGEWYLSGAIPEAYKAPNNLTQEHIICKPVKTRLVPAHYEIVE